MKKWFIRVASTLGIALLPLTLLVTPPQASAATRTQLKAAATAVAFETVGGSKYAYYKAKYPSSLNWTKDGCSVPRAIALFPGVAVVIKSYGNVFRKSCDRHDFGYRNFGRNTSTPGVHPKFSPTRTTKNRIDSRFYSNMKVQCDQKFSNFVTRGACKAAAKVFYKAVNLRGDSAFFG